MPPTNRRQKRENFDVSNREVREVHIDGATR